MDAVNHLISESVFTDRAILIAMEVCALTVMLSSCRHGLDFRTRIFYDEYWNDEHLDMARYYDVLRETACFR